MPEMLLGFALSLVIVGLALTLPGIPQMWDLIVRLLYHPVTRPTNWLLRRLFGIDADPSA